MRALVTGGTGFIGGHLVEALVAEGWEAPHDRHFGHYARAKAMAEEEVWRFHDGQKLPVT